MADLLQGMLSRPSLHPDQQQKSPQVQKQIRNKNSQFTETCYTNNKGWQTPRWESVRDSAADERAHAPDGFSQPTDIRVNLCSKPQG